MVVVAAVDRVLLEVAQRVVHPAHVPLEAEAQAADVGRPRDARPRGRLLGGRDDRPARGRAGTVVELLEERDRLEVLAPAELVGDPLALLARVVEVEHRGDGVDAEAVDVVLAQPVQRVGEQEVAHLVAAEVEDQRAPVGVRAAARVGVLVERGAVEARERPVVAREVRGHPVEDHADAALVQPVDEGAEVVGRAEARRGREVRRSPGSPTSRRTGAAMTGSSSTWVKPMSRDVGGQLVGQLAVGQRAVVLAAGSAARSRGGPRRSTSARAARSPSLARRPSTPSSRPLVARAV